MNWTAITDYLQERGTFLFAILGAAAIRFLLWLAEEPPENETAKARGHRAKRMWTGILIGMIVAFFGTDPLVNALPWLNENHTLITALLLGFGGEHIVRRLSKPDDLIDRIINRILGRRAE